MTINQIVLLLLGVCILSCLVAGLRFGLPRLTAAYRFLGTTILSLLLITLTSVAVFEEFYRQTNSAHTELLKQQLKTSEAQAKLLNMSLDNFRDLQKETLGSPTSYIFDPYLQLRERPREGKFVNVSNESMRRTISAPDNAEFTIYLFGGSTQFGLLVADKDTIASYLQQLLIERYGPGTFAVKNFGRSTYYSTQEALLLALLLRNGHSPDFVIFLDGLNENRNSPALSEIFEQRFSQLNSSNRKSRTKRLVDILSSLALAKAFTHKTPIELGNVSSSSTPPESVANYLFAQKLIRALSAEFRFAAHFFIQPIPGFRNSFNSHQFTKNYHEQLQKDGQPISENLAALSKAHRTMWRTKDLSGMLENYEKQAFIDEDHYTPEVHRKIAVEILRAIENDLDSLSTSDK